MTDNTTKPEAGEVEAQVTYFFCNDAPPLFQAAYAASDAETQSYLVKSLADMSRSAPAIELPEAVSKLKELMAGTIRYLTQMAQEDGNPNASADRMIAVDLANGMRLVEDAASYQKPVSSEEQKTKLLLYVYEYISRLMAKEGSYALLGEKAGFLCENIEQMVPGCAAIDEKLEAEGDQ